MPIKTIYVSENDAPVFEAAKTKSGGNLSATIVNALRDYVGVSQTDHAGFDQIQVKVGTAVTRIVNFMGMKLVGTYDTDTREVYVIYATRGGKYAVVTCELPEMPTLQASEASAARVLSWLNHNFDDHAGNYRLRIFASVTELEKYVPKTVASLLRQRLDLLDNPVEYLDI